MSRSRFRRALGAGLAALAATTYALAAVPPPAHALTNVIAITGSDTTQDLMANIITNDGLSATNVNAGPFQTTPVTVPADDFCNSVTYHLKQGDPGIGAGETPAPDGSSDGRDALRYSVNKTAGPPGPGASAYTGIAAATGGCTDIARSSGGRRATCGGGITSGCDLPTFEYYAYAVDGVGWATSSPNAPASLSQDQVQKIYNCTYTDWSQVGGSPGHITRVLAQNGSGTLGFTLSNLLGVSAVSALNPGVPGQTTGCTPIIQMQENQGVALLTGTGLTGTNPPFSNNAYAEAIVGYSAGKWTYQAGFALDPTVDQRGGFREGQWLVNQGTSSNVPVAPVRWSGTAWALNDASVIGTAGGARSVNITSYAARSINLATTTRSIASLATTVNSRVVTDSGGSFTSADVGSTVLAAGVPSGVTIASVTNATTANLTLPATATATVAATLGSTTVTDAGGTFVALADVGATVTGSANIPGGATIASVSSPTTAKLNVGAVAAGTAAASIDNSKLITVSGSGSDSFTASDVGAVLSGNVNLNGRTIKSVTSTTKATLNSAAPGAGSAVATTATVTGQVHNVTGISSTASNATLTAAIGMFNSGDVGKTIDMSTLFPGTKVTAVAVDGSSATISPTARFTGAALGGAIGFTAISEGNVEATSGAFAPLPGARYVYNVVDSSAPLYNTVRDTMVGFDDISGGAKSPLCSGNDNSTIKSSGFIPLAARNTLAGAVNVTCVKK